MTKELTGPFVTKELSGTIVKRTGNYDDDMPLDLFSQHLIASPEGAAVQNCSSRPSTLGF